MKTFLFGTIFSLLMFAVAWSLGSISSSTFVTLVVIGAIVLVLAAFKAWLVRTGMQS